MPVTKETLCHARCAPCEGGVEPMDPEAVEQHLAATPEWAVNEARTAIYRKFPCGNFVQAVDLIRQIADLAEDEQHHPDLHLTGYRNLRVELTTHAIGGLSENDFIVAAKIDQRVP